MINNLMLKENNSEIGNYDEDVYMMKYLDLKIKNNLYINYLKGNI